MADTTPNYGLDLYETGDPAALTDQYNASMHTLDDTIKATNDTIADVSNAGQETRAWLNSLGVTSTATATASKTRWDNAATQAATNKDDIADINENLTALGAETVNSASELNYFATHSALPKHLVCIGDSWSIGYNLPSPTTQGWNYLLAADLNMTLHNYADGGAGFSHVGNEGTTFLDQANKAANDKTFNHDNAIVLIMGNLNDLRFSDQINQVTTNAKKTLSTLNNSFPNSRIIYFTLNSANGIIENTSWINKLYGTLQVFKEYNITTYTNMMKLFYLTGDTYKLDANHLNQQGHTLLKNWVKSCILNGTDTQIYKQAYQTTLTNLGENITGNYTLYISDEIYLQINLKIKTNITNNITINIPTYMLPQTSQIYYIDAKIYKRTMTETKIADDVFLTTIQNSNNTLQIRTTTTENTTLSCILRFNPINIPQLYNTVELPA